jgi:hypothetical protein
MRVGYKKIENKASPPTLCSQEKYTNSERRELVNFQCAQFGKYVFKFKQDEYEREQGHPVEIHLLPRQSGRP